MPQSVELINRGNRRLEHERLSCYHSAVIELLPARTIAGLERLFPFFPERNAPDALLESHGLLPPLPLWGGRLVWGAALAHQTAGADELAVRPLPPGTGLRTAFLICLALENRRDGYDPAERLALYTGLRSLGLELEREEYLRFVSRDGGLETLPRLALLPEALRILVADGRLDLRTAEACAGLPDDCLRGLCAALQRASFPERRQAFRLARDIAADPRTTEGPARLRRVLGLTGERECLLRAEELLAELRRARYPELEGMRARFAALCREVLGGTGVRLEPPPSFEGDRFSLSFSFSDRRILARRIAAVQRLLERVEEFERFL